MLRSAIIAGAGPGARAGVAAAQKPETKPELGAEQELEPEAGSWILAPSFKFPELRIKLSG